MVQVQQTCACGLKYWPAQRWIHEKCGVINETATNTTATNGNATNKAVSLVERKTEAPCGARDLVSDVGAKGKSVKTPNRRDREAYNAYQREYMRKRRGRNLA